jgi:hypothetical protein
MIGSTGPSATLQSAYDSSPTGAITLNASAGPLTIRDGAPTVGNLFRVTDQVGSIVYLGASTSAVTINTNVAALSSTVWKVPGYNSNRLFSNEIDGASNTNTLYLQSAGDFNDGGQIVFGTGYPDSDGRRAESMRISPQGYVGIGTISPAHLVDVFSPIFSSIRIGSTNSAAVFSATAGQLSISTNPLHNIRIGGTTLVVNTLTGNVGIGTSSPGTTFVVNKSNPGSIGPVLSLRNATGNVGDTAQIRFDVGGLLPNGTIDWITSAGGNTLMTIKTTANGLLGERLRIDSGGNIGLGTSTVGSLLTVNGVVESITGGFKFPNGSVQTQAYDGLISFVPVPSGPTATGITGQTAYGAGYLYVAVGTNQWVRVAVETSWV